MVNNVTFIGKLGRDPELFQTKAGQAVARLSVATTRRTNGGATRSGIASWCGGHRPSESQGNSTRDAGLHRRTGALADIR